MSGSPSVVVGIMAYNEAANIGRILASVQAQTIAARIERIIVVASGCTDGTCAIVARLAAADRRIVLIEEGRRAGKIAALNTFLAAVHERIVVLPNADLELEPATLEHLVAPFANPRVGMVGAHPVPTNGRATFVGFAVNVMWELHHRVSSERPKMGELIAFRNRAAALDPAIVADELSLERQIRAAGFETAYAPDARVYNHGPETLREFLAQRERWCVANMQMACDYGLPVSTLGLRNVLRAAQALVAQSRPRLDWLVLTAALELYCRLRAYVIFAVMRRADRYRMWEPLASTKIVRREES